MEDHFRPVKTWRGYVMVSSCLLPPTTTEKSRIYPDHAVSSSEMASTTTQASGSSGIQELARHPPVPNTGHHEPIRNSESPMEAKHDQSPLYTPNAAHLAVPGNYFAQPDESIDMPMMDAQSVRSPNSHHSLVPAWLQNSKDWEYSSQFGSDEPALNDSPAFFATDSFSAPVTPLYTHNHSPESGQQQSMPVAQAGFGFTLPDPPRLELPPKGRPDLDTIQGHMRSW